MECYISTVVFATYPEDSKELGFFFLNHLLASPCVTLKKKKIVERSKEKTKNNPLELDTDLASNPDFQ